MTLTLTDFAPLTDVLEDNLAVIVGLVMIVAGFKAIPAIVRRYARI